MLQLFVIENGIEILNLKINLKKRKLVVVILINVIDKILS